MSPEEEQWILSLVTMPDGSRKMSPEGVLQKFGESDGQALGLRLLQEAVADRDGDGVELALIVASAFGVTVDYRGLLLKLADVDWHHSHEDIVSMLQQVGGDESVDALCRLTDWVPGYLDYDDSQALGVKAVWALSKIGTPRAVQALQRVSTSGAPRVSDVATQRLQARTGPS